MAYVSQNVRIICFIAFLLLSSFTFATYAARPAPFFKGGAPAIAQLEKEEVVKVEESCEGVDVEEECLMRRTLAAHTDYIYTQKHNP